MKTINYTDAKRDGTLYRYKTEKGYDACQVNNKGDIILKYGFRPTSDMAIIKNTPDGTKIST